MAFVVDLDRSLEAQHGFDLVSAAVLKVLGSALADYGILLDASMVILT